MMSMIRSVMQKYDRIVEENKELAMEVRLLRNSVAVTPQVAETECGTNRTTQKGLKGFDHKSNPKPSQYGLEQERFQEWDELLKAMMMAIDDPWDDILTNIQAEGKKAMTKERMK